MVKNAIWDQVKRDPRYIEQAKTWLAEHCLAGDLTALYEKTGTRPVRHRKIDIDGQIWPTKAFGLLMLRLAGDNETMSGDPNCTSNTMASLIEAHGYVDKTRR